MMKNFSGFITSRGNTKNEYKRVCTIKIKMMRTMMTTIAVNVNGKVGVRPEYSKTESFFLSSPCD